MYFGMSLPASRSAFIAPEADISINAGSCEGSIGGEKMERDEAIRGEVRSGMCVGSEFS